MTAQQIKHEFKVCATADQVDNTFRRLAKQLHPDNGGSTEEFVELQKAKSERLDHLRDNPGYKRSEKVNYPSAAKASQNTQNARPKNGQKQNTNASGKNHNSANTKNGQGTANHRNGQNTANSGKNQNTAGTNKNQGSCRNTNNTNNNSNNGNNKNKANEQQKTYSNSNGNTSGNTKSKTQTKNKQNKQKKNSNAGQYRNYHNESHAREQDEQERYTPYSADRERRKADKLSASRDEKKWISKNFFAEMGNIFARTDVPKPKTGKAHSRNSNYDDLNGRDSYNGYDSVYYVKTCYIGFEIHLVGNVKKKGLLNINSAIKAQGGIYSAEKNCWMMRHYPDETIIDTIVNEVGA